jgi:hypothetical protein
MKGIFILWQAGRNACSVFEIAEWISVESNVTGVYVCRYAVWFLPASVKIQITTYTYSVLNWNPTTEILKTLVCEAECSGY